MFKWIVLLLAVCAAYGCIRILRKNAQNIEHVEDIPMVISQDLDQPRSKLIMTIQALREENEQLKDETNRLRQDLEGKNKAI